ncbi:phosphatase PAP2 family protein [Streptomyces sp. NPDC051776]|uniref:phosphatase PAP2 family protein n=1 Tax=Streptomyces sp. NPDC051776 TaxID=3155414 RepID=UPI003441130E
MAGVESTGSNPDVSLLYEINGYARDAPGWFDSTVTWIGEHGITFAMVLLVVACWWDVRRREDAPTAVAGLLWAPLAAGLALLVNIPIRDFVERPRPYVDHQGLAVLLPGKSDYSFVSDHATLVMALAVGIFIAHRTFGLVGIALAFLEGFSRVYMGLHYPTDVVGGFALGTAVTLLLAPWAMALLTPLTRAAGNARHGHWLIAGGASPAAGHPQETESTADPEGAPAPSGDRAKDLAA